MPTQKITACAFIHHDGKMLAVQRAAHKTFLPNQWELVGGHIEHGETLEQGLAREIREELGAEVEIGEPIHAFTYMRDRETHSVEIIFLARMLDPDAITLDPNALQAYRWVTLDEARELYGEDDAEFPAIVRGFGRIVTIG